MKLIITGALGHVGSAIIHNLRDNNNFSQIILIDNLHSQRFCSLFSLPKGVNFKFIEMDILTSDISKYIDKGDIVIHLAAITDAASSFGNEKEVEEVNLKGTEIVAISCAEKGAKLFFPSTTSVYGVQDGLVDENSEEDLAPQSPYAKSKLDAENVLIELGKRSSLNFVICRLGTIFGYSIGMRFHTAVNKFCWQAVMNQPLTVWTTAFNQKRPYLDLNDCVRGINFIISNSIFDNEIYNVLTTNKTVEDIVNVIDANVKNIEIKYVDSEIMNQLSYEVSNQKFSSKGFKFKGVLETSISKTIDNLKNSNFQTAI